MSGKKASKRELTAEEREKILKETPVIMEQNGVKNRERAVFVKMISQEVVGSTVPSFFSMQPHIKVRDTTAWNRAYAIVFSYLTENRLEQTAATIDCEFAQMKNGPQKPEEPEDFEGNEDDFNDLMNYQPSDEDYPFPDRVHDYIQRTQATAQPLDESAHSAFLTAPVFVPPSATSKDESYLLDSDPEETISPLGWTDRDAKGQEGELPHDFEDEEDFDMNIGPDDGKQAPPAAKQQESEPEDDMNIDIESDNNKPAPSPAKQQESEPEDDFNVDFEDDDKQVEQHDSEPEDDMNIDIESDNDKPAPAPVKQQESEPEDDFNVDFDEDEPQPSPAKPAPQQEDDDMDMDLDVGFDSDDDNAGAAQQTKPNADAAEDDDGIEVFVDDDDVDAPTQEVSKEESSIHIDSDAFAFNSDGFDDD